MKTRKICAFVQGLRSIDDVLAGYKAVGVYDPSRWFLVCAIDQNPPGRRDLGCLLLTEHSAEKNWELIYFGVVPEARGSGLGLGNRAAGRSGLFANRRRSD